MYFGFDLWIDEETDAIDGKPRQEIIDIMKSRGFRWSPSNKAWQRQNTPNGVWSAKKVMEELKQFE